MIRQLLAVVVTAAAAVSCADTGPNHPAARTAAEPAGGHGHGLIPPSRIVWQDGPAALPPGAKFAVLEGDPAKPGFFAIRVRLPDGYKIPPHTHPVVERVTVISGTFHLGMVDQGKAEALPAGSYVFMPPGMKHFVSTEGETIIQIATNGPWGIAYLDPADDPRNKKK